LEQMRIDIGSVISLVSPIGTPTGLGMVPKVKRFVLVGSFRSGMSEYDTNLAYISLRDSQRFFDIGDGVTGIELRTQDMNRAPDVKARVIDLLGPAYRVRDWTDANRPLFAALKFEKRVYGVVLLLIVLVAAFNIIATLVMVVME